MVLRHCGQFDFFQCFSLSQFFLTLSSEKVQVKLFIFYDLRKWWIVARNGEKELGNSWIMKRMSFRRPLFMLRNAVLENISQEKISFKRKKCYRSDKISNYFHGHLKKRGKNLFISFYGLLPENISCLPNKIV